ncbi:MAG: ATP-binding protein [Pseudomonadota bacterium]
MAFHTAWPLHEPSQVGEARRAAVALAESLGLDATACGRVALVATELGTNLARHARQGRLLLSTVAADDGAPMVEMLSLDDGPGMADTAASLRDGHSTGGTSGTGLGAVKRLSDLFDLYSVPDAGTVILSRIRQPVPVREPIDPAAGKPAFAVGGVCLPVVGETVCGDAWSVVAEGQQAAVLVADGLGHGPYAAEASNAAVAVFQALPFGVPGQLMAKVHAALRGTRGAAVAIATADIATARIVFCGAGNIAGRLLSGVADRSLISQHGTPGLQIRRPQDVPYDWPPHALLILHSDGILTRWTLDDAPGLLRHHPAVIAAWVLRAHARGKDDTTVVVIKREDN